jgi:hypothetical protein
LHLHSNSTVRHAVWHRCTFKVRKDVDALRRPERDEQAEVVGAQVANRDDSWFSGVVIDRFSGVGDTTDLLAQRARHCLHLGVVQLLVPYIDRVDVEVASVRKWS